MKKIVTVLGARPQFVKAAVISRNLVEIGGIEEVIVHTGQHFDSNMSSVFFEEMSIPKPQYNLNINGLNHGAMTGQMMERLEEILLIEKPDLVLVYGDTNSTLAGALAAKKLQIKVAHVEAGLRSFNMVMPEEINRILVDRISDILYCPTETAMVNLVNEGFNTFNTEILNVGDVMLDAAIYYGTRSRKPSFELPNRYVLVTIHRGENTDNPDKLASIMAAISDISKDTPVVLPLHPRTRKKLYEINFNFDEANLYIIEPVGYFEMIYLLQHSYLVATDSGGLQKEAFFFKKLCLTLRDETEWTELVSNGFNFLCGSDKEAIVNTYFSCKEKQDINFNLNLYGIGETGKNIVTHLKLKLND